MVVSIAISIGDKLHAVTFGDIFGVFLHEALDGVPKRRDSLDVFIQTQNEAVLFAVVCHEFEGVIVDVAEEFDAGLNTPVPLILKHQGMPEEKSRLITAHVTVADAVTINDLPLLHILTNTCRLVLVNPGWETPVFLWDGTILCLARHKSSCDFLEGFIELIIIQENPIVVEFAVEAVLDLADRSRNLPYIAVASESDECSIHTFARGSLSQLWGRLMRCALRFLGRELCRNFCIISRSINGVRIRVGVARARVG